MKKLITLLLVSAFLFAVTIIPAHAAECEQHNYMYKGRVNIYEGTGDADGCDYRVWSKYECTRCGAVDYRGAGEIKKGSHLYYSVDLGHQPHNLHEYRRCCYRTFPPGPWPGVNNLRVTAAARRSARCW